LLTTRDDWKKLKEKHGIPEGICSFSMGERVAGWKKKDEAGAAAKDYKARLTAIEALLKDMKTYEDALKKAKPAKFKGKTPAEQAKNLQGSIPAFHKEITDLEGIKSNFSRLANPMAELQTQLKAARSTLAGIKKDDLPALIKFYGQQIRNDVGLPVIQVGKLNTDPKIKMALDAYVKQGDVLNGLCNTSKKQDPAQIWSACQLALAGLAFGIGAN
jgi:hypothetical protein